MTRKDFIFLAGVIEEMPVGTPSERARREYCAHAFGDRLGETNPNFNRALFIQAALGVVPLTARKPLGVSHA